MFTGIKARAMALTGAAVVVLATLAAPATAAPARPLTAAEAHAAILEYAAHMPAPSGTSSGSSALTLQGKAGGASTNLVITCVGSSRVNAFSVGSFYSVTGYAYSSCPAPVDYVAAQATLFFWSPDLSRWFEVAVGNLAYDQPYTVPGRQEISQAESGCVAQTYGVVGFHQARLGTSYATGYSSSTSTNFSFCLND
ncbi:hypothetical protein Val02_65210 [Virgisporangium aliadipatigenens]|uniref:Secreted protein n=1 Tax=Virgisporangium aliadipatigenens TaxID=741659 RepID=A0A8J3YTH7_9ACTN|nr:hypothetical protein [Virgisporangium aliadipatigenens]GIJ49635.1 hypothetical protein Val02_65210 [Virgisporangium aliadipatigenens]